jgi:hypothetical protein
MINQKAAAEFPRRLFVVSGPPAASCAQPNSLAFDPAAMLNSGRPDGASR